jgi:hypothetical protein
MVNKLNLAVSYFTEIYSKSFLEIWGIFGMTGLILNGLALVGVIAGKLLAGDILTLSVWSQELDMWIVLFWFFLLVSPVFALFNSIKVAAIRDKNQREIISSKDYQDIQLQHYPYPDTLDDMRNRVFASTFLTKIGLLVNNGKSGVKQCGAKVTGLWHLGDRPYNYGWSPMHDNVETRYLKWDEGYTTDTGKIDIGPHSHALLRIIEANPHSGMFHFVFLDGMSKVPYILPGKYMISIQVEGQIKHDHEVYDLNPICFVVMVYFNGHRLLFVKSRKVKKFATA